MEFFLRIFFVAEIGFELNFLVGIFCSLTIH